MTPSESKELLDTLKFQIDAMKQSNNFYLSNSNQPINQKENDRYDNNALNLQILPQTSSQQDDMDAYENSPSP